MPLRLVPVIEFTPSGLGVGDFCSLQDTDEWPTQWATRLESWSLHPIQAGSWFVATSEFTSALPFDLLLRVHVRGEAGPDGFPELDQIGPIPGGLAFAAEAHIQLEPGCCCDLSNLDDWRGAFRKGGCVALTIGHGVYSLDTADGVTTVKVECERAGVAPELLCYPEAELEHALACAVTERDRFAALLVQVLTQHGTTRAAQIAQRLAAGR